MEQSEFEERTHENRVRQVSRERRGSIFDFLNHLTRGDKQRYFRRIGKNSLKKGKGGRTPIRKKEVRAEGGRPGQSPKKKGSKPWRHNSHSSKGNRYSKWGKGDILEGDGYWRRGKGGTLYSRGEAW